MNHPIPTPTDEFDVTDDHLALLRRTNIRYATDPEFGAPAVDPKRPYGDGNVLESMTEILDIEPADWDDDWDQPCLSLIQTGDLYKLHQEMTIVLQILVANLEIRTGTYARTRRYDTTSWMFVSSADTVQS